MACVCRLIAERAVGRMDWMPRVSICEAFAAISSALHNADPSTHTAFRRAQTPAVEACVSRRLGCRHNGKLRLAGEPLGLEPHLDQRIRIENP